MRPSIAVASGSGVLRRPRPDCRLMDDRRPPRRAVPEALVSGLTMTRAGRRPGTRRRGGPGLDEFARRFGEFPCGAAVKTGEQLEAALRGRAGVVFILRGN